MNCQDLLQRIAVDLPSAVRFYQKTGVEISLLRELAGHLDTPGVDVFLASMPDTPSRILEALLQQGREEVLLLLASHPFYVSKLIGHSSPRIRAAVASGKHLTQQQIQTLAADSNAWVRVALAANPVIPNPIQLKLASDLVPFVRLALLKNRRLTEEFQIGLGDDIDTTVHAVTLMTPKLSEVCMKIWAEFDEELGQLLLARRRNLPEEIVRMLCASKYASVRRQLLASMDLPVEVVREFAKDADESVALALLQRKMLAPEIISALFCACRESGKVALALASHPALTDEVALALLEQGTSAVTEALIQNVQAPIRECRRRLVASADAWRGKMLLANPAVAGDGEMISILAENAPDNVLPHLVYRRVQCGALSPATRARLAASPLPSVRALVQAD